jgi:hypothetical protein
MPGARSLRCKVLSHPHGEHLFGLSTILAAFPRAKAVALPEVIPAIEGQVSPQALKLWRSRGGMIAQQIAQDRPSVVRRIILVGTAPRGGEDIMHLEKPSLAKYLQDSSLKGYAVLQKIFFAPTASSQQAGAAFVERLGQRREDRDPVSGPGVAQNQMIAFREWEHFTNSATALLRTTTYRCRS